MVQVYKYGHVTTLDPNLINFHYNIIVLLALVFRRCKKIYVICNVLYIGILLL